MKPILESPLAWHVRSTTQATDDTDMVKDLRRLERIGNDPFFISDLKHLVPKRENWPGLLFGASYVFLLGYFAVHLLAWLIEMRMAS